MLNARYLPYSSDCVNKAVSAFIDYLRILDVEFAVSGISGLIRYYRVPHKIQELRISVEIPANARYSASDNRYAIEKLVSQFTSSKEHQSLVDNNIILPNRVFDILAEDQTCVVADFGGYFTLVANVVDSLSDAWVCYDNECVYTAGHYLGTAMYERTGSLDEYYTVLSCLDIGLSGVTECAIRNWLLDFVHNFDECIDRKHAIIEAFANSVEFESARAVRHTISFGEFERCATDFLQEFNTIIFQLMTKYDVPFDANNRLKLDKDRRDLHWLFDAMRINEVAPLFTEWE